MKYFNWRVVASYWSSLKWKQGIDDKVLIEVFLEGGSEFTAIVIDIGSGTDCHPVVLLPTEVSFLIVYFCFFLELSDIIFFHSLAFQASKSLVIIIVVYAMDFFATRVTVWIASIIQVGISISCLQSIWISFNVMQRWKRKIKKWDDNYFLTWHEIIDLSKKTGNTRNYCSCVRWSCFEFLVDPSLLFVLYDSYMKHYVFLPGAVFKIHAYWFIVDLYHGLWDAYSI